MSSLERFHQFLQRHHKSHTRSRDAVFQALADLGPCTKQELAHAVAAHMDQATTYRTVQMFLELGIASVVRYRQVELGDAFKPHHHHFICNICRREITFNDDELEATLNRVVGQRGLLLEAHAIELTGRCDQCRP